MSFKHLNTNKGFIEDKTIKYYSIINNTKVNNNINLRDALDNALKYEYDENTPIEFKEYNINRIMVNSIRHDYSNYELGLKQVHKLNLPEDMYFRYKNIVLDQISYQYPFLKDECERQKHNVNMVNKTVD